MTSEEKQLLLKNLCARLPYGVKVEIIKNYQLGIYTLCPSDIDSLKHDFKDVKPYLRPMSSMTDDEEKEMQEINHRFCKEGKYITAGVFSAEDCGCTIYEMAEIMSYLNAHHFDYRGLIPMGLALEAPEDMYK